MAKASKLVILGIDSISIDVLDQMIARGYCPTLKRLIEHGCYAQGRSFCPVETGTNWAVLATGASPAITGVNMQTHVVGQPLNSGVRGFPSHLCKAEQIWNAARRAGKRSLIFDYPQSRPYNCEGAIHVGEDGRPGQGYRALTEMHAYKTSTYAEQPKGLQGFVTEVHPEPAVGWKNLPTSDVPYLAAEMPIEPWPASEISSASSLWMLLVPEGGRYTSVAICGDKDYAAKLGEARVGQWTDPLIHTFDTDRGPVEAATRAKLFELSPDGKSVHLYHHQLYPTRGFAHPEHVEQKLYELCGPYYPHTCRQQSINSGAADVWTFHEELDSTVSWYLKAMDYLFANEEWDLFIQKWHPPDFAYHFGAFMIDDRHPLYDPARHDEGWDYWGKVMNRGDQLVAKAWEAAGEDALVAVMSDHGGKMVLPGQGGHGNLNDTLVEAGLQVRSEGGGINWSRTKAFSKQHYVFVNLKGRDPDGVVEPGKEYQEVRQQIIDLILAARDEHSGRPVVNLACRREDAYMVGIGGEHSGDVFYWTEEPPRQRGYTLEEWRQAFPDIDPGTWERPRHNSGGHNPDPFILMGGLGLKKGYRRERPVWLNAFAPTLSLAWGTPVPKDADGAAIWDFLE